MSEIASQPGDPASKNFVVAAVPEPEFRRETGFPATWLTPSDKFVIDGAHWNEEAAPEDAPHNAAFSVQWNQSCFTPFLTKWIYGVEIAGLIIRLYFDLPGCVIPVAHIPGLSEETFIFTIAGDCNVDGKKNFYLFHYGQPLRNNSLHRLQPAFSSVADFYQNCSPNQLVRIQPRSDKEAETRQALIDCEFLKVPGDPYLRSAYKFGNFETKEAETFQDPVDCKSSGDPGTQDPNHNDSDNHPSSSTCGFGATTRWRIHQATQDLDNTVTPAAAGLSRASDMRRSRHPTGNLWRNTGSAGRLMYSSPISNDAL
ncbi:hypothetical protein C8R45DRAFT_1161755 [Mycena sanguinolenta]|nr:hypothetical protein C8R45DRAFT_1161755 [Mycena sanguinolenta]